MRELAYVDEKELGSIEGFDEETARELQERAREYLAQVEAQLDARRAELGVNEDLREIPGMTTEMLVALGENDVKPSRIWRAARPTISPAGASAKITRPCIMPARSTASI